MAIDLFAGIRVRDCHAATSWYERRLGREPAFIRHATDAVWKLPENRYLFIVEDRDAPGGASITIFVDDLDALGAEGVTSHSTRSPVPRTSRPRKG